MSAVQLNHGYVNAAFRQRGLLVKKDAIDAIFRQLKRLVFWRRGIAESTTTAHVATV